MLLPALLLATRAIVQAQAEPITAPAGYTVYETRTAGYDSFMHYGYTRRIIVLVGPAEKADGYPEPPALEIRNVIAGVEVVAVPEGQKCDPAAEIFLEYGRELFPECLP